LETELGAKTISIPYSLTTDFKNKKQIGFSDLSLRHAAYAAGLGTFGRHNIIIHPQFGSRVNFTAIVTDLDMESDVKVVKDLCIHCDICFKNCPGKALEKEGYTDLLKCYKQSQHYGFMKFLDFMSKYIF